MERQLGTAVLTCPLAHATLVVEVARRDGLPLSSPPTVRLSGAAARTAVAGGSPARANFTQLPPGAYEVEVEPADEEADFEVTTDAHEGLTLAGGARTAVRIELESEDSDIVTAGISLVDDVIDDGDYAEDDDPTEWEVTEGELHEHEDDVSEEP